jgi:hypothetical protein
MVEKADRKAIVRVLDDLENRLNALRVHYDQYFSQAEKREPVKERQELDRYLQQFTRRRIIQTDLRFRQMTLSSRFYSYCQYWDRIVRRIEEGKFFRDSRDESAPRPPSEGGEETRIGALYEEFIRLRHDCGLSGFAPGKEQFAALIGQQREKIASKLGNNDFELQMSVVSEGGKPRIRFQVKRHS